MDELEILLDKYLIYDRVDDCYKISRRVYHDHFVAELEKLCARKLDGAQ
jgi:hypothetical protein